MHFKHTVEVLALAYIGGRSTLWGGLLAAFLVIPVFEYLKPLMEIRLIIYGFLLVLVMMFYPRGLSGVFQTVEERAAEALRHPLALFLGGDHSVTIPLMRAFNRVVDGPFGVLHFDAHPDICDTYEGHRWSHACTERRALELSGLEAEHLVFVGLRSFMEEEWDFLKEHPEITFFTARQCYRRGIEEIAEEVVEKLRGVPAVYFTLDIDGLDPAYAPGTGTPEGGGLTTRDLLELVRVVFQELPVRAMDVVEVSPPLDQADITSFAALKVIYEAWWVVQEKLKR